MTRPLIYLAGPIAGTDLAMMQPWRKHATLRLNSYGIDALDPLRGMSNDAITQFLTGTTYTLDTMPAAIFNRDRTDVLRADGLLVNLSYGEVPSVGTMFEMAWAHLRMIPIVLVIDRETEWHKHVYITQAAGWVCTALDDAIDVIGHLFPQEHNV